MRAQRASTSPDLYKECVKEQLATSCTDFYSLIWAPPIVELSDRKVFYALFSVGDGDILQHNPDMPDKEPINLSSYFKTCDDSAMVSKSLGRTDLAWNHDRSLAAVGNDNGVLYIVDGRTFNHIHTTFAHKKLVQCVVWHPATVTSENTQSPFNTWLASASDNVQVMNVTSSGVDVIASLNSHTEKVVCIAWSPHFNGLLITASYDYTSQVWDVVSGAVLACFDAHHGAVVCVLPSAFHKDWVITGSADNTVRVWNTKNFRLTKTKTKKQRLSGALKKFTNAREATELISEDDKVESSNHRLNGDSHTSLHSTTTKHVEFAANLVTTVGEYKRKPKSMFPVTSSGFSQAKHLGLLWSRISGCEPPKNVSTGNSGYLDFFGDMASMKRLFAVEETHHRENGNAYYADQMALWSGNIASRIAEAGKKKQLNDWLVSLAPMVSHRLWVECCRQYAKQLVESGDTLKAVSYYLVIHQFENAVEALMEAKLFREAVSLAKLRCMSNDQIVKSTLTACANQAMSTGMLTQAAHCMISIGANIEAVEILSRSKDPENLSLASNIAVAADANEMGLSLAMRAMNTSLEMQNYTLARGITNSHSVLEDLNLWIDVCELKKDWKPIEDKIVLSWIVGKQGDNWLGLYESAFERCKIRVPSYLALTKFLPNKPTPESDQKVWVYIAGQVCLAAAAQLKPTNGTHGVLRHLITALEAAYNFHLHNPANPQYFLQLCLWISPWGPLSTLPQFDTNCEYKSYLESFNAFLACGVVYWLEILSSKEMLPIGDSEAMAAISNVIVKCSELLFHKDVIAFHKADVEIKRLENAIASSKLEALKIMKSCKDIEAALTSSTDAAASTKEAQPDVEDDSKKLIRLKQFRADFEEKRLFVPNPFIAFCSLRNVLELTVAKSPEAESALHKIKDIWDKSSADVATA
ncbi:unnamed protein product [Nesidiocoris tenuis]|uniref:Gem-associated protein 5 TPR domain-containing protein n=1 Tax=Nesidiocoris tenuis TaxID=355587 RepID=A0A6H5G6Z0_9HEMI|nr:unnamed protein product [Nesidiocoris tenuis]